MIIKVVAGKKMIEKLLQKSITPMQIINRLPGNFAKRAMESKESVLTSVSYLKQCFVNCEYENIELKQKIAELEAEIEKLRTYEKSPEA